MTFSIAIAYQFLVVNVLASSFADVFGAIHDIQILDSKGNYACMWLFCLVNVNENITLRFQWTLDNLVSGQEFTAKLEEKVLLTEVPVCYNTDTNTVTIDDRIAGCEDTCAVPAGTYTIDVTLSVYPYTGFTYLEFSVGEDVGMSSLVITEGTKDRLPAAPWPDDDVSTTD